jgi:hypothetical protein
VIPHVTKNDKGRASNLDRRTTRQPGYTISLSRRWLVEKGFGWLKQTGPLRQVKLRGLEKVDWLFVFSCAAHNLSISNCSASRFAASASSSAFLSSRDVARLASSATRLASCLAKSSASRTSKSWIGTARYFAAALRHSGDFSASNIWGRLYSYSS